MELKFNFRFCMALENGIPCLPGHLVLLCFWNTYLNFPFRFLFSYGTGRGILIFCFRIAHNEKRISMQNGFNFALLFFVKTYLNFPLQANKL